MADTSSEMSDTERMVQEAMAEAQASLDEAKTAVGDDDQDADAAEAAAPQAQPASADPGQELEPGSNSGAGTSLDLLGDVELQVMVELGRTNMLVEDVLRLAEGSVVELDKLAGDPVDVYVNHRLIARGEVLVLNDNFCIRISEIVADLEQQAEQVAMEEVARA